MEEYHPAQKILKEAYDVAFSEFNRDKGVSFLESLPGNVKLYMSTIGEKPEKRKAVIAVLATLFTKKVESPTQDIRYHREDLELGFSGRSYDTKYVTPFIKKMFGTKFAMKESGWLTRSFEKPEPYLLNYTGKISPPKLKEAFLHILDEVQKRNSVLAKRLLIALFIYLLRRKHEIEELKFKEKIIHVKKDVIIAQMINALNEHFSVSKASRLPVIAMYSIYKILIEEVERFRGKTLKPLRGHVSPNFYAGLGDIEIVDENGEYFEIVEVKYNKPIDEGMIEDVYGKIKGRKVKRYYLLTTAEPYIKIGEEIKVGNWIEKIMEEYGCEVIVNGVISTINYYLRLMRNPSKFLEVYTYTLNDEFESRAEVTEEHIKEWQKRLRVIYKIHHRTESSSSNY
jgi:DNA (cytosine-5)-methyltransferase 1